MTRSHASGPAGRGLAWLFIVGWALLVTPARAGLAPGGVLGSENWEEAKNLLPEEFLEAYRRGDFRHSIGDWTPVKLEEDPTFAEAPKMPKVRKGDFISPEEDRPIARFEETLPNGVKYYVLDATPNGQFDNVGPYKVPAGHYFMMGDNRDNSTDSREQSPRYGVGYVPFENLVGRAEIIFFSAAVDDPNAFRLTQPWHWPMDIRWNRIFSLVR